MSSHHIVREKQEPALLVINLHGFDDELLGQLLEWNPTVIAAAPAAQALDGRGIKVDWLVSETATGTAQPNVNHLVCGQNKPVETALAWLTGNKYPAVNIITPDFNPSTFIPYLQDIAIVVLCRSRKIYPVSNGFNKWKPAGEIVELLSKVSNLEVDGMEQVEKDIYKTTTNGIIRLRFSDEFIFIGEQLQA